MTNPRNIWVNCPCPNPEARLRLFCFPYAGGGASIFRTWAAQLSPEIEVCPVQLPGRENRFNHLPFRQLTCLIQTLLPALLPEFDRPFAFFGHSLGGLISFELARQLQRQNFSQQPLQLFVSACRAPQLPPIDQPIHQLPEPELIQALHQYNGTPEVLLQDAEMMALMLPMLRADFSLSETYSYVPLSPLHCPISAFGGLQDKYVSWEDLAGWSSQTFGNFTQRMFQGNHFFLKPKQEELLQAISQDLTRPLNLAFTA
ncbi:MAG: thioesterase II family protein [Leptolyngbyaceae cyanobacterium MO_188.B28]|nr:thioesterase II family protein [Leptolyngbyaceae cyanobacterium MO_188.B28]